MTAVVCLGSISNIKALWESRIQKHQEELQADRGWREKASVGDTIDSMVLYMRRGYIQVTDITYSKQN
ncbi:unnamed protein product [Ranitomeya imitator]|uniref:Uncharacterized protein n=1 Tax=Ranitomeya imitator TaxID=111125 RepID=A0ABN9MLJ5_9NEOB|nr:unnamed protein product [Ranitomeya imitator]